MTVCCVYVIKKKKKMFTNKTKTPDIEPIIRPRHYRENNRLASFRFLFLFFFLMIRREMIYSSVITAREVSRWRTRCTCLFFLFINCTTKYWLRVYMRVSDITAAMIHHQKQQLQQQQPVRVPKSICDLSEDVLASGVQFPGESERKITRNREKKRVLRRRLWRRGRINNPMGGGNILFAYDDT